MEDLKLIIANNLQRLMEMSADCKSAAALSKKSKVAQTTISNYLRVEGYPGAPTLDKLLKLAECFGIETWQLLHPALGDKELKAKEIEMYRRWKEDFERLKAEQ